MEKDSSKVSFSLTIFQENVFWTAIYSLIELLALFDLLFNLTELVNQATGKNVTDQNNHWYEHYAVYALRHVRPRVVMPQSCDNSMCHQKSIHSEEPKLFGAEKDRRVR